MLRLTVLTILVALVASFPVERGETDFCMDKKGPGLFSQGCSSNVTICNSYGRELWLLCPFGLVFDGTLEECVDFKITAECSAEDKETKTGIQFLADLPAEFCENAPEGFHALTECSSSVIECSPKGPRLMECPLGFVYDDVEYSCVEPSKLGTCPPQANSSSVELTTQPAPVNGSSTEQPTEEGSGLPVDSCEGLADGIFERTTCSPYYLSCSGGIARVMYCPANLVFDKTIKVCNYPRYVAECDGLIEESGVCQEDGFFSYGNCSDQFYACSNGRQIPMMCPAKLAFDEKKQLCDYPMAVDECTNEQSGEDPSGDGSGEASGEESGEASGEESGEASGEESGEASGEESGEASGEESGEASGEESGEWSGITEISGEFSGEEIEFASGFSGEFSGETSGEFSGDIDGEFSGEFSGEFVGEASGEFSGEIMGEVSPGRFSGVASGRFLGTASGRSSGTAKGKFTGVAIGEFSGEASGEYSGEVFYPPEEESSGEYSGETSGEYSGETSGESSGISDFPVMKASQSTESTRVVLATFCIGKPDSFYAVGCSSEMIACVAGAGQAMMCPADLIFDEEKQMCDYPENVPCWTAQKEESECQTEGVSALGPCQNSYRNCVQGKAYTLTCDEGYVFSETHGACVEMSEVPECETGATESNQV